MDLISVARLLLVEPLSPYHPVDTGLPIVEGLEPRVRPIVVLNYLDVLKLAEVMSSLDLTYNVFIKVRLVAQWTNRLFCDLLVWNPIGYQRPQSWRARRGFIFTV